MSEPAVSSISPADVISAFESAAITALGELTQFEAFADQASISAAENCWENCVVAVVRLLRNEPGTMTLVLTPGSASCLASRYLPQGTQLTEDIIDDVAGEFANVIAGQAKTILKRTPYHFTMSPPTVARTKNFTPLRAAEPATLFTSLVFESGRLLLYVELCPCPGA